MICNKNLAGIPLLILANKQDIPDCMGVREVKPIFNQNAHLIGRRDFMVMPISALTGYLFVLNQPFPILLIFYNVDLLDFNVKYIFVTYLA